MSKKKLHLVVAKDVGDAIALAQKHEITHFIYKTPHELFEKSEIKSISYDNYVVSHVCDLSEEQWRMLQARVAGKYEDGKAVPQKWVPNDMDIVNEASAKAHAVLSKRLEQKERRIQALESQLYDKIIEYDTQKIRNAELFVLLKDIVWMAQNDPVSLVAFNSPILQLVALDIHEAGVREANPDSFRPDYKTRQKLQGLVAQQKIRAEDKANPVFTVNETAVHRE